MKHRTSLRILKQMKRFIKKIIAVCLAFFVLFATSSFTMDMHLCCNKLVDVAIFGKAKTCEGKKQDAKTTFKKCSFDQKNCCSNKSIVKWADDNLKKSDFELDDNNMAFLQTFIYAYVNLFEGLELKVVPFENYAPPFIKKDILLLDETFLI